MIDGNREMVCQVTCQLSFPNHLVCQVGRISPLLTVILTLRELYLKEETTCQT